MHSAFFKWNKSRLKVRTRRCHATDTVAVWSTFRRRGEPRGVATNAGRGEGWKLGPLCPTMMWNSPPKTHIDCNIYILLYHLYRIWRSNTFSVGLQLYHPISCSSYLHNTFYCFPREKHFAFQSSWQVARHGSFAAVTEQDALTETSARSPGEDEHFGWLVISKFIQFHDLYSLIYPCVDDSCVMYVHLISIH